MTSSSSTFTHRAQRWIDETWHSATGREPQLDPHTLLDLARRQALLEDFGSGDFREGFDQLVDSLNESAELHTQGRWAWRDEIVALLINRLGVRDWTKKNPDVRHEIVERPLVVTGFDPVGVRLLAETLDHDPMLRSPRQWEASSITPPAGIRTYLTDARIASIDGTNGRGPASCDRLIEGEFAGRFMARANIPTYGNWFAGSDLSTAYELHHLQLQILQAAYPTQRWSLHGAVHAWHLDSMLHRYPDALVVWVHRDPVSIVAEVVEAQRTATGKRSDQPSVHAAAANAGSVAWWADHVRAGIESADPTLDRLEPESVFHLQHLELADDPVGSVARIYRHFTIPFETLARHRMQASAFERQLNDATASPPRPGPDLIPAEATATFDEYVTRFQIPREMTV